MAKTKVFSAELGELVGIKQMADIGKIVSSAILNAHPSATHIVDATYSPTGITQQKY